MEGPIVQVELVFVDPLEQKAFDLAAVIVHVGALVLLETANGVFHLWPGPVNG